MSGYKHEYAGIIKKIKIKAHGLFIKVVSDKNKQRVFYRSYRHIGKKKTGAVETALYMTQEPNPLAGFGHGIDVWRSGISNAKIFDLNYAYCPMPTKEWDTRLGLGEGMTSIADLKGKGYRLIKLPYYDPYNGDDLEMIRQIIASYKGERIIFLNEFEQPTDRAYSQYACDCMKKMFWASSEREKDSLAYDADSVNIAVHIRRGDVTKNSADPDIRKRWLDNTYYEAVIKQILAEAQTGIRIRVYIFSEGDKEDFKELETLACPVTCFLNTSIVESFIHMCRADILVVGLSSFSADPGHINPSLKIVPSRFWGTHPDNGEWIVADEEGNISEEDRQKIKKTIKDRISSRL